MLAKLEGKLFREGGVMLRPGRTSRAACTHGPDPGVTHVTRETVYRPAQRPFDLLLSLALDSCILGLPIDSVLPFSLHPGSPID